MVRRPIPLSQRLWDIPILVFFGINIIFITYVVDIETLIIPDPAHFSYPFWPPRIAVDVIHWYGRTFDPVLMARPPWWRTTIWIDALFFGPFYIAAIYAYLRGREWIRIPSIIYASALITIVLVILSEERFGEYATPQWTVVLLLNLPWLIFPAWIIYRMWRYPHPFTREAVIVESVGERTSQGEALA